MANVLCLRLLLRLLSCRSTLLVKHTIDTLKLLEEKTKGNLNDEEQDILKHILYDLKMRYVAKAEPQK
jgi:hypothetical protein